MSIGDYLNLLMDAQETSGSLSAQLIAIEDFHLVEYVHKF